MPPWLLRRSASDLSGAWLLLAGWLAGCRDVCLVLGCLPYLPALPPALLPGWLMSLLVAKLTGRLLSWLSGWLAGGLPPCPRACLAF